MDIYHCSKFTDVPNPVNQVLQYLLKLVIPPALSIEYIVIYISNI